MINKLFVIVITVTVARAQVTGLSGWDIFIDPGHSQNENMGIYNYSEAMKNLGVGLELRDLLLSLTDIDTVTMSRTNAQQYIGLTERCNLANSLGASWYHSLHSNAPSTTANSTLLLWGELYNGQPDPPVGGEDMSDIMIDLLTRGMRTYTVYGSIGDCSFYTWSDWCAQSGGPYLAVNRLTAMPSELSEAGFHTNPQQNQLNMNEEWKRLEAWTFFWSILRYHNLPRPTVGILAGIVSDLESNVPINGAIITLNGQTYTTDSYTSLFYQYSSDPDQLHNGFYYFENLPDSSLELIITADDYYPDTLMVSVLDTFFTFQDVELLSSRAPYVVATTPVEGDTSYPTVEDIIIDFSREMDPVSVELAFSMIPDSPGIFSWTNSHKRLIYIPDLLDYLVDYQVVINDSAHDIHGHLLDGDNDGQPGGDFILQFRSGPMDIYPPEIIAVYPQASASDVELHPIISITYNEIVGPDSVINSNIRLERFADHTDVNLILEHFIISDHSIINLFPVQALNADEVYVTRIGPGIIDLAGNATLSYLAYSFSTISTGLNITDIDPFEQDITSNWEDAGFSGSNTGIVPDSIARLVNTDIVNHLTGSTKSLEIKYGWDVSASSWLLREYLAGGPPRNVHFNSNYILQVYVFGDGSNNKFRFAVDDHVPENNPPASHHEVSPWFTIDWYGWKLVSWDMTNDGTGTWIGDGNLDGTLRFDSIQLTYTPGSSVIGKFIFDDLRLVQEQFVSISEEITSHPTDYQLFRNYPNPFNPQTTIAYYLPYDEFVQLNVYNFKGELIRILENGNKTAGIHQVVWNGKNNHGVPVSSGVYIYRLATNSATFSKRMLLIK